MTPNLDLLLRFDIFDLRNLDLLNLFLHSLKINVSHFSVFAIEDLCHLFKSNAASFDKEDDNEDELKE